MSTTIQSNSELLKTKPHRSAPEKISGPAWNNSSEYTGIHSNEFKNDRTTVLRLAEHIKTSLSQIAPLIERSLGEKAASLTSDEENQLIKTLQSFSAQEEQIHILMHNLWSYVNCERCIDGKNAELQKTLSQLQELRASIQMATEPASLYLQRAPESVLGKYLRHPHTKHEEFSIRHARKMNHTLLSESEETLAIQLRKHGLSAWSELYNQISANLECRIQNSDGTVQVVGLAQASGQLRDASETKRRTAWSAIQEAWKEQSVPCASILNSIAGWRLDLYERRSHKKPVHFLDFPLHQARIQKETLNAMFEAIEDEIETPRKALRLIAQGLRKPQIDPWDLMAPPPATGSQSALRDFKTGLHLIRSAFHRADPTFGDFVSTMEKNRWIEGRVLPNKRPGAFCTGFLKSRTPRVYQTYMGSISDIRTLAHELGHAYHSWVLRDLPYGLIGYPMTLAETASIFAETVFADHIKESSDTEARFEIAWQNAETAASLLLNIPARFDFEKSFYERRKSGFVPAEELNQLTTQAWQKWYGDTLSQPESQYWMSKLHFSMEWVSFYNFPYTFGYLFSLAIYALRSERGADFMPSYVALLRDTGRMTAEDLIQTHLGEDITKLEFWKKSLKIVSTQVTDFENLLKSQGTPQELESERLRQ